MEDEESERQRKLKAGREKLMQFQQKNRGGKKKKKTSGRSSKSKSEQGEEGSGEIGGNSPANSEQDVSIASADTDKDISSIASEVEEQIAHAQQTTETQLPTHTGGESTGGSYASESYTSGDESFTSEDGGVDDLVIANLERNELKNRTVELEEELVAKKTALKEISKENTELKSKLDNIVQSSFDEGHAKTVVDLNERIQELEETVSVKQSSIDELQRENVDLRKRIEASLDLDQSESSQVEELKGKLVTKQVTLDELNKQNEELSVQVENLKYQLGETQKDDVSAIMENLKIKENSVQQLGVENENQRAVIKSLEEALNQSKAQVFEYQKTLQLKDQELQQVANSWKEYLSQNVTKFNEQLAHREHQLNVASQEISRLQLVLDEKGNESVTSHDAAANYANKLSELTIQLEEKTSALEDMNNQVIQFSNKQKQGEEEVVLLKTHIQEQTERLISMQETLDNSNAMHNEKDNKIATLEQQLESLSQINEDMSINSKTVAEQMLELRYALDNRNQSISQLEKNLHELAEERELLKNEMASQTQDLINQMKDLRSQLQESNAKLEKQSDEMETSFSELHVSNDMIQNLQKEMLEKDLALDNTRQKLESTEEILEKIQKKFVEEKERLQNELNDKESVLEESRMTFSKELDMEKSAVAESLAKIQSLSDEVENYQKQAADLQNEVEQKDETVEEFRLRLNESKQRHEEEIESLKLQLEYMKEGVSDSGQKMIEVSEEHQEQLRQSQVKLEESAKQVEELKNEVEQRDELLSNAKTTQLEALEKIHELQEKVDKDKQKYNEEILTVVEKQQEVTKATLLEAQLEHQNETNKLTNSHAEEMGSLKKELDHLRSSLKEKTRLQNEIEQMKNDYEKAFSSMRELNSDLKEELVVAQQQLADGVQNQDYLTSLKEKMQHQEEEHDKMKKLSESLALEKEDLLAKQVEIKSELGKYIAFQSDHGKEVQELNLKIESLEGDLTRLQESEERLLGEKTQLENLLQQTEGENEQKVLMLTEKLQLAKQNHESELQLLRDELITEGGKRDNIQAEKDQTMELLMESQEKVTELEDTVQKLKQSQDEALQEKQQNMEQESEVLINEIRKQHETKVQVLENKLHEMGKNNAETVAKQREVEELLQKSDEELREAAVVNEKKMKELCDKLQELQEKENSSVTEQQQIVEKAELEFLEKSIEYENENKQLQDRVRQLEDSQATIIAENKEIQEKLNETQSELLGKREEHENEIRQMDEQLEQTRQFIETVRADCDGKLVNLKESLNTSEHEFKRTLAEKENEYQELIQKMQSDHEGVKGELERTKNSNNDLQKRLQNLVSEKEELIKRETEMENFDWNSNSFQQQPVIEEKLTSSDNWIDVQGETDDGWDWSVPEENISSEPTKVSTEQQPSLNELESLERIAFLQEKLAEKEKNEVQLIEEKNKLLKIVKEYNDSLTNERDSLKEKINDQDETIKNLQDQLSMSELVSSDIQQVFAQQLLVLEKQRDSLLNQLDEEQKERSSFVDILEEKHALEENLRSEKEELADKLRQKGVLERQLDDERAALQEQLIRQARLNEIIREKDVLEQELTEQKNRLQHELSAIEDSLLEKEQLLDREKEALRQELQEKEYEMETWQGELKSKEEREREQRELLEKNFTATLLSTRTELEDTYQQNLEHLRTELEDGFRQRLIDVEEDYQTHHKQDMASLTRQHEQQIGMWYELAMWLLESVSERECFQVAGVKAEYEERIKNLKQILEEQRQRQVTTMKSVLERDRATEVQHLMDNHDDDMENLRKELNIRHQDIVNAIVARLKQTHQQEMEDCLAEAVTDTVLKVEVARLEVEKEYEAKFEELKKGAEMEIGEIRKMNEEEVSKLESRNKEEVERREILEKQHEAVSEDLRGTYEQDLEKQLTALRNELNKEHEANIEKIREDIEEEYENQMETLQDELEEKYEKDLRELREELDKQGHEITASAIEELQRKHFAEIDALREEHEQIHKQMLTASKKEEDSLKEDMQVVSDKLELEKERAKEMSIKMEEMLAKSKEEEDEKNNSLQTMEQKITFLEHEHEVKITDMQKEIETKRKSQEDEYTEQLKALRNDFEKEKMEMELKHITEVRELSNNNDKKLSDKDEQHISEIHVLQQKLALLQEENEDNTFRELEESRQQLSEKFQKDLDTIVRELKLQHQKEIDHLISEAESNQSNADRYAFETWKTAIIEKYEKEMRELRQEQQKELEATRTRLENENSEEISKLTRDLNARNVKELEELRKSLTKEFEQELSNVKIEHQNNFDSEINNLVIKYQSLREQHEETVRELNKRLNSALSAQIEPLNNELRVCKDLMQEKEMEIENLKRQHEKSLKEMKQRNFDDLVDEVSEVRADLALDAAREVEIVKLEADYENAKKIKEIQDGHLKEITEQAAMIESLEKDKKSLEEHLRSLIKETQEQKEIMENERNELKRLHEEEIQDLKTRLEVEQQNTLNELKGKLMKEMDNMHEMWKQTSDEEHKELSERFMQREEEIKALKLKERDEILNKLKTEHENEITELKENLKKEHEASMQEMQETYEGKMVKEKDEALKQASEQHHRDLEAMKQELVETHMQKFTSMTEELEKSHQEELETKLREAKEMARYNLEKEHLENLKNLENDLQQKHEKQLNALKDLVEQHRTQINKLKKDHEVEKEELEQNWQKRLTEELAELKNDQREEMLIKEDLLDKAETEIRRAVLEIETKDKNINEMTEFIEKTSREYEERLGKIRKDFDDKLEDMKSNTDSSNEEQLRGVQEMLSQQHADELERLKAEHDKHIELANNELEGERVMRARMREELEEKLSEHLTTAAEQEKMLKNKLEEMKNEIAELKGRNDNVQKALEEKENEYIVLQEQKQALDMDVRTLEGHIRDIENREERQQRENANLIHMLRADLDAMNSERDSVERAKAKLVKQLTAAVKTTIAIEDTITSRLETLFEQTMQEEDDEQTVSEVASLPDADDATPEGFRRRQAGAMLASSTPAAPQGARALDDSDDNERTVTEDKQADLSLLSDEGLEVSVILSDNQGSLDIQNDETVVDSGNRLRVAVKKLLDIVASVSRQLNDARKTQDELLNTTTQRTEELNQLTQAQNVLMLRLQEEIETKEEATNRLRNAEEEMEAHVANEERLENLLKETENEKLRLEERLLVERNAEVQQEIEELIKEKEELLNGIETLKSKTEDMEKAYEKEKQLLCEKIKELQNKVKDSESELHLHLSEDSGSAYSGEQEEALPEEKPATSETDELNLKIESLEKEFKNKEKENVQLKEAQKTLINELSNLKDDKVEIERELSENKAKFLNLKQEYEKEIQRVRSKQEQEKHEIHGNEELLKENETLKKEVATLKISVKSLTSDLQNISKDKDDLQNAFQESEIAWEEEKNNLQQQLFDSCLEASSFKDQLNKMKAEVVTELERKLSEQTEAHTELKTKASNLETEVDSISANVEELKEGLVNQQYILEEHRVKLIQAENEKAIDEEEIRKLKDALVEAESHVEEGETKMQEILKNMKNLESTYKTQTNEVTQLVNEKLKALQEELTDVKIKLDQEKQSNNTITAHINDLKQQHMQEMLSCKAQFETDVRNAVERTKLLETVENSAREEPILEFTTEQQSQQFEEDLHVEYRLNNELKNVDGFTRTIAGYLSELSHESFGENGDMNSSTTEKIESVLDDLRLDASAVYKLVNSLPAFHDHNVKSLQTAWEEERQILRKAIEQLTDETSTSNDWRGVIVTAVLDVLKKEEEILSSELDAIETVSPEDEISASNLIRRRQQQQDDTHRESLDRLYEADRMSLLTEIEDLKKSMLAVKQELTNENNKLEDHFKAIQQQVKEREKELLQQVTSREELLQKAHKLLETIKNERDEGTKQLIDANNQLTIERNVTKELKDIANKNKSRLKDLESALENEKTQNTVIKTCLESERARCSNLEQALKHERLNVDSRERELEKKSVLLQDISNREHETIKDLEDELLLSKQQLSELETQLREEKTKNTKLQKEQANKDSVSVPDNDKMKNLIHDLRNELERTRTENGKLVTSINEERKVSEDLKSGLESLHGVDQQIAKQEQLITELSKALENERRVNEELRNALDNDYEETEKADDTQRNVVKELQISLTAVQEQLRNQIDVVDQERSRVKRLRKERDIHEASALGARTKERNLERDLEKEKAAREMEVGNLKDILEHECALKRNLEEVLNARNSELETLSQELQCLKDGRKMAGFKTPPNSPSKDRLNILRHDLKSIIDEHRVLLIMHKEYLEQQLKNSDDSPGVRGLYSQVQNLSFEMDRMKKQVSAVSEGSPIRLSPVKTAAYDRIVKQNKEMSDYLAKLTDEKSELRSTLCHLELQVSEYRDREANHLEIMQRNKHETEAMLSTERSRAAQDRLALHQTVEGQKKKMNELQEKLCEKEMEVDEAKRSLQVMEDQVEKQTASARRLQSSETRVSHWTPTRIQKLYARYIRAEKSRKSLVYQKKYLVLLLGGFRENETRTLAMIAKMGAYPSFREPYSRFSPAFTKFRTAVRVVVATKRMQFLVAKSKKSIKQVMEPLESEHGSHKNTQSTARPVKHDQPYRKNYRQDSASQSVLPRYEVESLNGFSSQQGETSMDTKDTSFADIYTRSVDAARPKQTVSGVYSAFDYRPNEVVTHGLATSRDFTNLESRNRLEPRNIPNMLHSPPVRERPNNLGTNHSSIPPPFCTYPYQTEPRRDVRTTLNFDSEDLDRKIQTLDNLQQKLSLNRGTKERDR